MTSNHCIADGCSKPIERRKRAEVNSRVFMAKCYCAECLAVRTLVAPPVIIEVRAENCCNGITFHSSNCPQVR